MKRPVIIGIDLGTTFSAIARVNDLGKAEIISNREGERITPSVVLFDGESPIVGSMARRSSIAAPLNVCQLVKRQMGEPDWRFFTENDEEYSPEEVSGIILERLRSDAGLALGFEVEDAVITVPAYFNDAQRKATQDAGRIGGLTVHRIINEPTAAALAYGLDRSVEETVMVYDLGGGTFDVTVMRVSPESIDVLATGGDKNLGGFNWDGKVMEYLNDAFIQAGGPDLHEELVHEADLRDKAELAKKTLSSKDSARVFLSAGGATHSLTLTRDAFESVTRELLDRTRTLMVLTLEDARLDWPDVDKILLVGGSTRMTAISSMIESLSGKTPSGELHPDEVVAMGAALLGEHLNENAPDPTLRTGSSPRTVRITDVNSHGLGVVVLDGNSDRPVNSIILPKDTTIGTRSSRVYSTTGDRQTSIELEITEGDEEDVDYVHLVGTGTVEIPPYPRGAPVEITFQYDEDGIIQVEVFDKTAERSLGKMRVQRKSNRSPSELERMAGRIRSIDIQ